MTFMEWLSAYMSYLSCVSCLSCLSFILSIFRRRNKRQYINLKEYKNIINDTLGLTAEEIGRVNYLTKKYNAAWRNQEPGTLKYSEMKKFNDKNPAQMRYLFSTFLTFSYFGIDNHYPGNFWAHDLGDGRSSRKFIASVFTFWQFIDFEPIRAETHSPQNNVRLSIRETGTP